MKKVMLALSFVLFTFIYAKSDTINDCQKEIKISREREDMLAQKNLALERDIQNIMHTFNQEVRQDVKDYSDGRPQKMKFIGYTESGDCKDKSKRTKVYNKENVYVGEIIESPCTP